MSITEMGKIWEFWQLRVQKGNLWKLELEEDLAKLLYWLTVERVLVRKMSKLIFVFLSLIPLLCTSFSPERPSDRRVLVLLDDFAIKSSHSLFFNSLKSRGFDLQFHLADDPKIALQRYGQYLYDALILFSPTIEREFSTSHPPIDMFFLFLFFLKTMEIVICVKCFTNGSRGFAVSVLSVFQSCYF